MKKGLTDISKSNSNIIHNGVITGIIYKLVANSFNVCFTLSLFLVCLFNNYFVFIFNDHTDKKETICENDSSYFSDYFSNKKYNLKKTLTLTQRQKLVFWVSRLAGNWDIFNGCDISTFADSSCVVGCVSYAQVILQNVTCLKYKK